MTILSPRRVDGDGHNSGRSQPNDLPKVSLALCAVTSRTMRSDAFEIKKSCWCERPVIHRTGPYKISEITDQKSFENRALTIWCLCFDCKKITNFVDERFGNS